MMIKTHVSMNLKLMSLVYAWKYISLFVDVMVLHIQIYVMLVLLVELLLSLMEHVINLIRLQLVLSNIC